MNLNAQLDAEVVAFDTKRKAHEPRIKLVPFDQIRLNTDRAYLVKGLIPYPGLTVIWGPPKCGKSFWTLDVVMSVVLGTEYRGRRVHQGPIIYCAFEGQSGIRQLTTIVHRFSPRGWEVGLTSIAIVASLRKAVQMG
jgi:RecA-family ATPase